MNETAFSSAPAPPVEATPAPPPPTAQRPSRTRRLLALLLVPARHPRRVLAVLLLLLLLGGAGFLIGRHFWGLHHLRLAQKEASRHHYAAAQEQLQPCLSLWPEDPESLLLAARCARRLASYEDAERFLDLYQDVRGDADDDLIVERILLRAERGDLDAVRLFCTTRIEQDHPTAPLILEALTHSLIRTYRLAEARWAIDQWLKRVADDPEALRCRAILEELRDEVPQALRTLEHVLQLDPEMDDARVRLARLLHQSFRAREALPHLEQLRGRQPDSLPVSLLIAQCLDQLGKQAEAQKTLDELLARAPHYATALGERGRLALRAAGRPGVTPVERAALLEQAEKWLRQACALEPGSYHWHYQLYQCLSDSGKTAEAQSEQKRLEPLQDDMRRIQAIAQNLMQKNPHDPKLHYEAGVISLRAGAREEGLRWLRSALKEDPHYAPAHRALADYYLRIGNRSRAAHHRRLAGDSPNTPPATDERREKRDS